MDSLVLKKEVTSWIKDHKKKDKEEYCKIDKQVKEIIENYNDFIFNDEERIAIMDLEFRMPSLIKKEEMEWRLNIRYL